MGWFLIAVVGSEIGNPYHCRRIQWQSRRNRGCWRWLASPRCRWRICTSEREACRRVSIVLFFRYWNMLTEVVWTGQVGGWYRKSHLADTTFDKNLICIKNIQCNYTAIVAVSQPILEFMTGAPNAKTIPFGVAGWSIYSPFVICQIFQNQEVANLCILLLANTVTFRAGDPKYKHLNSKVFVADSRYIVSRDPLVLEAETRISEVVPATETE